MYNVLLTVHFLGLSIGAGTGVYLAALASYAARQCDRAKARELMLGAGGVVSAVGLAGLILLLVSGILMVLSVGGIDQFGTAFRWKMAAVAVLVVFVTAMKRLALQAKRESTPRAAIAMKKLGPVGPALAVLTIGLAVSAFH